MHPMLLQRNNKHKQLLRLILAPPQLKTAMTPMQVAQVVIDGPFKTASLGKPEKGIQEESPLAARFLPVIIGKFPDSCPFGPT
jgi:hypothetical protein